MDRITARFCIEQSSSDSREMLNIFEYGTLHADEANDIYAASARSGLPAPNLIGITTLRGRLCDFGRFPGMRMQPDGVPVVGEVYSIEEALLPVLDDIEQMFPGDASLFTSHVVQLTVGHYSGPCLLYPIAAAAVTGPQRRLPLVIESGRRSRESTESDL